MGDSGTLIVFQVLTVFLLILTNGFFVAAEFSLVTVRRSRVEEMVQEGNGGAKRVSWILRDLDTVISATQLGITMASLGLGWVGEPFLAGLIQPLLSFLPQGVDSAAAHSISVAVSFAVITYLHIVLGELAPKSMALQRAEGTAVFVAGPMLLFARIFRPFIVLLNGSGNLILRLVGVRGPAHGQLVHSEEELRIILLESRKSGVLEEQETELIQNVFDFKDVTARQVMVPRTEMVCIPLSASLSDVLEIVLHFGYTRFPVYGSGLDDIVGIMQVKDVLPALCGQAESFDLRGILHAPVLVPETVHIDDLLSQFRRAKTHMALLLDEFGGTAGLVTMQDVLEEIVGEVSEGMDGEEVRYLPQDDGSIMISGKARLADVNDRFELQLYDPHYVTLGGLVFSQIGRRPRLGDEVDAGGVHMRVEALEGLRVAQVRMTLPHKEEPAEEQG